MKQIKDKGAKYKNTDERIQTNFGNLNTTTIAIKLTMVLWSEGYLNDIMLPFGIVIVCILTIKLVYYLTGAIEGLIHFPVEAIHHFSYLYFDSSQ